MSTRKLVLSSGAVRFLKDAEKRLKVLEALRIKKNANLLKKTYRVENVTVLLQCGRKSKKIIMWSDVEQILFVNATHVWGYNYTSDALSKHLALDPQGADLEQAYSPGGFVLGTVVLDYDDGIITPTVKSFLGTPAFLPARGVSIERLANDLVLRSSTGASPLAVLPAIEGLEWGDLHSAGTYAMQIAARNNMWNQANGPEAWNIYPDNPSASMQAWRWTPRCWFPDQGNLVFPSGIYYGKAFQGEIGPANEIKVTFGGLLDDRLSLDEISRQGYCEILTDVDDTKYLDAYFFLELHEASRASFYYWQTALTYVQNSIWDSQPEEDFVIGYKDLFPEISGDLTIHWWTGKYTPEEGTGDNPNPLIGILAHDDLGRYTLHRWHGYMYVALSGLGYMGHSVSSDGAMVAVFVGAGAFERVIVYDISKNETVRDSTTIAANEFTTGAIIPIALPNAQPPVPPETAQIIVDSSQPEMAAALGGVWKPTNNILAHEVSGWKTFISDGKYAVTKFWTDTCWTTSQLSIITPQDIDNIDRTHSVTVDGQLYSAASFAALASDLPYMLYSVAGLGIHKAIGLCTWDSDGYPRAVSVAAGTNSAVETFERAEIDFGIQSDLLLVPSQNAKPPHKWSGDVEFINNEPHAKRQECTWNVKLEDDCGLIAEKQLVRETGDDIVITGPDKAVVGAQYSVTGGAEDHIWGTSCGTFDEVDADTIEITSIDGCCDMTISVLNGCQYGEKIATIGDPLLITSGPVSGVTVGSTYTASGGVGTLVWSAVGATVDQTGEITALDACVPGQLRIATITVTDECGQSDSLEVELVDGSWVEVGLFFTCTGDITHIGPDCGSTSEADYYSYYYAAGRKSVTTVRWGRRGSPPMTACCGNAPTWPWALLPIVESQATCFGHSFSLCDSVYRSFYWWYAYIYSSRDYEWRCP